ncbi:MAG TPA: tetratricopeptide repeat protein [Pyrinomonadaceae bacterium]|nr:tetratricopeptide repeat protein [Pyrinomonadaceae bacterium]
MNCFKGRIVPAVLLLGPVLTFIAPVQAQNSVTASARPAISVLDSTKEQDGLVGSVRRVKTETAKIELKDGHAIEGPPQLVEVTTYGIKGNRIENTSYPIAGSLVGKEEYKYDERGNITEMTLRDERGAIVSREAYTYDFDKFGNWTRMVTSLVVFENGALKREPVEVTYRTVTYYFDDNVAKVVEAPAKPVEEPSKPVEAPAIMSPVVPEVGLRDAEGTGILSVSYREAPGSSPEISENPPSLVLAKKETPAPAPVTASAPPAPAPASTNHAMDLYQAGRNRFDAGDVKGAIDAYLESVKLEPNSAEVFLNLGHAYLKLDKNADAIKAFKQSVKLNPDQAESQYGLGVSCFRSGRHKEAADAFKKATILSPSMAKAHYGLSLAYGELGETNKLLDEYRILERLDKALAIKVAQTFPEHDYSCRLVRGCP